jgi:hypothetical protein
MNEISTQVVIKTATASELQAALAVAAGGGSSDDPIPVAYIGDEHVSDVYTALAKAGKYVALDLSKRAESVTYSEDEGEDDEAYERKREREREYERGMEKVVELVLPDSTTRTYRYMFGKFGLLKKVSGTNVKHVGEKSFSNLTRLTEGNFPEAVLIGENAFEDCTSLTTVILPKAVVIDNCALFGCKDLTMVNLSEEAIFDESDFSSCDYPSLTEVTLGSRRVKIDREEESGD